MNDTVNVTIPVDAAAAKALENPLRREAIGRVVSDMLVKGTITDLLAQAVADLKQDARSHGLTDDDVDAELAAWRAERDA